MSSLSSSSLQHLFSHNQPADTPITVVLQQQQIDELAGTYLASNPGLPFQAAHVTLDEGAVGLTARTSFSGLPISLEVVGLPTVESGLLRFAIRRITMNGAPAPGFIAQQIESAINTHLGDADLPIRVEEIEVSSGEARIRGRTK